MSTVTGGRQIFAYVYEDEGEFDQDPAEPADDDIKSFGIDETMDTQDRDQNTERLYKPFERITNEFLEGGFDGSWSADFILTNGKWLPSIYGEPEVSGDEHTFSLRKDTLPRSMQIIEQINYPDGEIEQTVYTGAPTADADVDVSVGDPVSVSLSGDYADEETASTAEGEDLFFGDALTGLDEQPDDGLRPVHYGNSELLFDLNNDGTADFQSLIQDVSVSINANVELEDELGTRFSVVPSFLNFEPDLSFTRLVSDDTKDDQKRLMYGDTASQTPQETLVESEVDGQVILDVGIPDELNEFVIELNGTFPDSFSRNNVGSPEDVLEEDVDRFVREVDVTVTTDEYDPSP